MNKLIQINAPHFCAGLEINEEGTVVIAAPILKWTLRKRWIDVRTYFIKKGYEINET